MNLFEIKIDIHPIAYLFMILSILTGYLKEFFFIMLILLVHECGHILMALFFRWKIEKVKILPLGSITIFRENINRPLKEELLILLAGPGMQLFFFVIAKQYILDPTFELYHWLTLSFNLLPIVPLDGSKLVNIISNYWFPYFYSEKIMNFVSGILLIGMILVGIRIKFNMMYFLMLFLLSMELYRSIHRTEYLFYRFLLERYQKQYIFKKNKQLYNKNMKAMKRDTYHIFYIENKCYSEREMIAKKFDFSKKI